MPRVPVFGVRRLFLSLLLAGFASAAAAQSNVVAPPPPARPDTVGPEQLRSFALPGTQQRSTGDEAPASTAPTATTPTRPAASTTTILPPPVRERSTATTAPPRAGGTPVQSGTATPPARPADSVSLPLPRAATPPTTAPATGDPISSFGLPTPPTATPDTTEAPTGQPSSPAPVATPVAGDSAGYGWLMTALPLLALALAGGLFAWWWSRHRREAEEDQGFGQLAFAGAPAPSVDEPVSAPRPAPAPRPVPTPAPEAPARAPSVGLVSSRLRAWLDLDLGVRVAAMTAEELVLEVDIVLSNNGSAATREIAVEALVINAGPEQDKEIATFFARPDATDFARDGVQPMGQMALSATLRMPRGAFQEYLVGGGKVVVPIVALNASYKVGSARGRSSAAFLVGRAGADAEKLGPFPTDQGAKGFNRLGLKRLADQVRR